MKRTILIFMVIAVAAITSGLAICTNREYAMYRSIHKIYDRENRFYVLNKERFCDYQMQLVIYKDDLLTQYGY